MPKKTKNAPEELPEEVIQETAEETPEQPSPPTVDYQDRYTRCLAEFDNYRKRTAKEMAARYDDGIRAACDRLLPTIDNFQRALATATADDPFTAGILMIARQFEDTLSSLGVAVIETPPGTPFDPNIHNAVATAPSEDHPPGSIIDTLQPGYQHKERVLRPAMVRVVG